MKVLIEIPGVYYNYTKKYHDLSYIEKGVLIKALMKGIPFEEDEDCISRSALDEMKELVTDVSGETEYAVKMSEVRKMLSVQPKQRTGRWIKTEEWFTPTNNVSDDYQVDVYTCSYCKSKFSVTSSFCPNCGAKMEEVNEK